MAVGLLEVVLAVEAVEAGNMIGIFDSGSGGLTVLSELRKLAPNSDIVYFGDLKNAPYGNKSREELGVLTALDIQKLVDKGATEVVSACNSVSLSIVEPMFGGVNLDSEKIIEMIDPTVSSFKDKKAKVLVVATKATIESKIYKKGFSKNGISSDSIFISELVYLIENGESDEKKEKVIFDALEQFVNKGHTHLILGCTHFPFVRNIFEKVLSILNMNVFIVDPAEFVAKEAVNKFNVFGKGETHIFVSKKSDVFESFVKDLFSDSVLIDAM